MKTTKTHGILLGLGVLGASTLLGALQPAQAAPTWSEVQYRRDNRYRRPNGSGTFRPGYSRPSYVRPGYNRPGTLRPSQTSQTITGRVTKDLRGSDFNIRSGNGPVIRVVLLNREPRSLSRNDQVQVSGYYRNGVFQGQSMTILRNR